MHGQLTPSEQGIRNGRSPDPNVRETSIPLFKEAEDTIYISSDHNERLIEDSSAAHTRMGGA